jgi:hypothetical protein
MPRQEAIRLIERALAQLTRDHSLNTEQGLFRALFGRDLSLPEFMAFMLIEKDFATKFLKEEP